LDGRLIGIRLLANDRPGSDPNAKQQILLGLSDALSVLAGRMRSQGDKALKITLLAVSAEKIAQRAWDLNSSKNSHFQRDSQILAEEIKAFAKDVAEAATRAGEQALLGREVANAIEAHALDIATLARDIEVLPDAAAVRSRLRPLSVTLSTLPERLKANAATIQDVNGIAALAIGLAESGERLAAGGPAAHKEAVAVCRDLRNFAETATAVSLEMTRGAALAVKAISDMAERTVGLSRGNTEAHVPLTAHARMMDLVRAPPQAGKIWEPATPKIDTTKVPPVSIVWGTTPVGKN